MPQLLLHGTAIDTVFDLLGRGENDMTYALGWGLARSPTLLSAFARSLALDAPASDDVVVRLQQHEHLGGFTDIELSAGTELHLIVEAKRGSWLPSRGQLDRYAERFAASAARQAGIRRPHAVGSRERSPARRCGHEPALPV